MKTPPDAVHIGGGDWLRVEVEFRKDFEAQETGDIKNGAEAD